MASPRQKMVIVGPPQPTDLEQKKKRQTLERAKANHLSKQLQMRLQYAKLKVEHGWQRQNLNEVENLYFHHSHQRSMRQGATQRPHYATATVAYTHGAPNPETHGSQPAAPSGVPDRTMDPSPLANDPSSSAPVSPPSQSPSEHGPNADGRPISHAPVQTPVPLVPASTMTNRPPSALDFSDPNILVRLAQLHAQSQTQPQSQTLPRHHSSTTLPAPSSSSAPQPTPVLLPIPAPGAFAPHFLQTSHPLPGSVLYPIPASTPHNNTAAPSHPPLPTTSGPTAPIPAAPIPMPTPIAPSALTYDSFWSTHASSTGSTRALYRTPTGFTASATPGGNVAMLTPGGHAAVMTAEGVYVGGASK